MVSTYHTILQRYRELRDILQGHSPQVIGTDIGFYTVKMVEMSGTNSHREVTAVAMAEIEGSPSADPLTRATATSAAISKCHKELGSHSRYLVCGVAGPEVAARSFHLPASARERLEAAVLAEAADVCPFNVRQGKLDYQVVDQAAEGPAAPSEKGVSGIMVAATNAVIEARRHLVQRAGLKCVLMDVEGLATVNLFNECEKLEAGKTTVIVNVGGNVCTMVVIGASGLPFIRDFDHGNELVVSQIAEERGITPNIVTSVLNGTNADGDLKHAVSQSMSNACGRLVKSISETLRYHMTQERGAPADTLHVCGTFSQAEGFVETLGKLLNLQGKAWNPLLKMKVAGDARGQDLIKANGSAFVVATGLAMRSL